MPVPAILGLPALMTYLGSAVSAAIIWIIQRLTVRLAVYTAALVAVVAALNELYSEFSTMVSSLALQMPAEFQMAGMFLPSNTGTCMQLIMSAHFVALSYRFVHYIAKTKMDAAT